MAFTESHTNRTSVKARTLCYQSNICAITISSACASIAFIATTHTIWSRAFNSSVTPYAWVICFACSYICSLHISFCLTSQSSKPPEKNELRIKVLIILLQIRKELAPIPSDSSFVGFRSVPFFCLLFLY